MPKSLKNKGFLKNRCRDFDKEGEGKGEDVQSFAHLRPSRKPETGLSTLNG